MQSRDLYFYDVFVIAVSALVKQGGGGWWELLSRGSPSDSNDLVSCFIR